MARMSENVSESEKMTPKQAQAIDALLTHKTFDEAADAVGVNPRTLYRWMKEQGFRAALSQAENKVIDGAARQLLMLSDKAVKALESVLTNPGQHAANVKRLAAVSVLDYVMRLREFNQFEERLAQLEKKLDEYPMEKN